MKKLKTIYKILFRIIYSIFASGVIKKVISPNKGQVIYLLVGVDRMIHVPRYLVNDTFIKDLASFCTLNDLGYKVKIIFPGQIKKIKNQKVIMNYSRLVGDSYIAAYKSMRSQLEEKSNLVFPRPEEFFTWENKAFMYRYLADRGVPTPETRVFPVQEFNKHLSDIKYPVLLKEEHSCSSGGLYKLESEKELLEIVESDWFLNNNKEIILQNLLNMRRDLRVIFVGNELVLHYWRINQSSEWKPTSTSYGSDVDFDYLPGSVKEQLQAYFDKLGFVNGAFDVAWEDDNLDGTPLVLEVSPNYQPNPNVDLSKLGMNYGEFKKKFFWINSYDRFLIDTILSIHKKYIKKLATNIY